MLCTTVDSSFYYCYGFSFCCSLLLFCVFVKCQWPNIISNKAKIEWVRERAKKQTTKYTFVMHGRDELLIKWTTKTDSLTGDTVQCSFSVTIKTILTNTVELLSIFLFHTIFFSYSLPFHFFTFYILRLNGECLTNNNKPKYHCIPVKLQNIKIGAHKNRIWNDVIRKRKQLWFLHVEYVGVCVCLFSSIIKWIEIGNKRRNCVLIGFVFRFNLFRFHFPFIWMMMVDWDIRHWKHR